MPGETWPVSTPVAVVRERVRARTAELDRRRRRLHLASVPVTLAVIGALVLSVGSADPVDTRVGTAPASEAAVSTDDRTTPTTAVAARRQPGTQPAAPASSGGTAANHSAAVPAIPALGTTTTTAPVPAPSGRDIAFTRDEAVWLMKADGSGAGPITRSGENRLFDLDWRPDGRLLAATEREIVPPGGVSRNRVVLVHLDGRVQPLTPYEEWGHSPRWSPDGRRIAFQRFTGGGEQWNDLWLMDADGSDARELVKDFGSYQHWSPDGREIAYQCGSSGPVCILTVDSGAVRQVAGTGGLLFAGWAPDGRLTFLRTDNADRHTILTTRTDGTDQRTVATLTTSPSQITWSPKARSLAFKSLEKPESCVPLQCPSSSRIWRMDADGTDLRPLTSGPNDWYPDWSPAA